MYETTSGVATLPHTEEKTQQAAESRIIQLLITEKQITDDEVETIIGELSQTFQGSIARSTKCAWLSREEEDFCSGNAVAVEITVESGTEAEPNSDT